ncbi:23S rRNA (guanine745-N1)-methyltransferase [Psychromicrobium silvestre]|uniref:23S rRNA (Guanine745-N1)-methyltransferase n=1 Tax=Psychromicrobium silvestre TaxID=1645614 RepID=A0A7Y9S5W6_9MICC|nr:methyltransferase domain-containing protein [Psychromicrobium silvestre]NYE94281.1 23S rRNA (guanine745-N1)-methyltransferase [Psychromicrobium silvestre]
MRQDEISPVALQALICPVCAEQFTAEQQGTPGLLCGSGHRFDFSRHGYLNLLSGNRSKATPETATMIGARSRFLEAGHFAGLARVLSRVASRLAPQRRADSLILEAGVGTGYYLKAVLEDAPAVAALGLDLSPEALRRAARALPGTLQVVWDLWRPLPLAAKVADVVLVVFAPRNAAEYHRVLRSDGVLLVVTPLPEHLSGLPQIAGRLGQQQDKQAALHHGLSEHFELIEESELRTELLLSAQAAEDLIMMGPSGHHLATDNLSAALDQAEYRVQEAFQISAFRPIRLPAQRPVLPLPQSP